MGQPEADWKRQPQHALDWLTVGLALALVAVFLGLWSDTGGASFAAIAALFAAWLAVYFTPLWQPVFYVLGAVLGTVVALALLYFGNWTGAFEQAALLLDAAFVALAAYLFIHEEPDI